MPLPGSYKPLGQRVRLHPPESIRRKMGVLIIGSFPFPEWDSENERECANDDENETSYEEGE